MFARKMPALRKTILFGLLSACRLGPDAQATAGSPLDTPVYQDTYDDETHQQEVATPQPEDPTGTVPLK